MRRLLAATCLTPAALLISTGALRAETVIDTELTTPVRTSTIDGGAADDILIDGDGSITLTSGVAVTMDSNNAVQNDGTIEITGTGAGTGILANANLSGNIANTGTITVDEEFTPEDEDEDGDIDGPFAQGSNRFGIRVAPGGTHTGNLLNSGTIKIEGNQSAGISVESTLDGSLTNRGGIAVVGNNSYGIRAGDVTGDVRLTGLITAKGENSVGVALDGDIGGALSLQGGIVATGYRSTTAPSDTSDLDEDDLLQGGPALRVSGNVAGGIIFAAPPKDLDEDEDDEDNDGIDDDEEGTATVTSYGAAPAVQIGSAEDITIGAVAGAQRGHGIVIDGSIAGFGVYEGVSATGLQIGGLGGNVTVAGGLTVNGSVIAESRSGNATGIELGAGAEVREIRVGGKVTATGGKAVTTRVEAIAIEEGATINAIRNTGQIAAAITGGNGRAAAIIDRSGTLDLVENKGSISAGGGSDPDKTFALDLRANTTGVTIRQLAVAEGAAAPSITGTIQLGSGDDLFDIADGTVTGTTRFGGGSNRLNLSGDASYSGNVQFLGGADTLALSGTSKLVGNVDFGGGRDTLTLGGTSILSGTLSNSAGLAVTLNGGTLDLANADAVALASLNVTGGGGMTVTIDGIEGTNTLYDVAGAANFAEGSKVNVKLNSISESEGTYVIVQAGTLTGGDNLVTAGAAIPFLFASSLEADDAAGEVELTIRRKTATELGLNRSEASAYDAIIAALDSDADVADVFLAIDNGADIRDSFGQLLPNHAGGIFETVTQASRATSRFLADPRSPMYDMGGWGFFLQQVAWGSSKDLGNTAAYDLSGWGASGGAEIQAGGVGNFGLSVAYLLGKDEDGSNDNEVNTRQAEIAGHWRNNWDALQAFARVSYAYLDFEGMRRFTGSTGSELVTREARGDWSGDLFSASAGLSYELNFGRLAVRPGATIDYYRLKEDGYTETGGGDAMDLIVDSRTSDETAVSGTVALGYDFVQPTADSEGYFRLELEGGRRQLIGGSLGSTTAHFADGEDFILVPDERESGWLGQIRLLGGNDSFQVGGEFSAEEQQDHAAIAFRATLQVGF